MLPPLPLDDDEGVAVALGLLAAARPDGGAATHVLGGVCSLAWKQGPGRTVDSVTTVGLVAAQDGYEEARWQTGG